MDAPTTQYAANEADAEAGGPGQGWGSKTRDAADSTPISSDPADLEADGPFSPYCADNAPIWKLYMGQAKISDDNLANTFNSDLDPLLIFAGLFSAILSAFLIEIRKGLQEDLQTITNTLLTVLIENQRNATASLAPTAPAFTPSSSSRWVNGLWFSSLMFSLMSALGASLAKGWITQFSSSVSGSTWADASLHCQRFGGLRRWHLKLIIECLPILIHIGFFLFSIGLVILLLQDDFAIGIVLCAMTGVILVLYAGSSIHPAFSSDSPFRTPVSGMVRRLMSGPLRFGGFAPFPTRTDVQKARALSWMLAESSNPDITNTVFHAIAGLPANPAVQDELFRGGSLPLLLRLISAELGRTAPGSVRSWLFALFRFIQTAPVNPEDGAGIASLIDLVNIGGPLVNPDVLPYSVREIAVCVKSRIILLLSPHTRDATLFDTEIPVRAKVCADVYLRRLLLEAHTLWRYHDHYLAVFRAPDAIIRTKAHAELVKHASTEHCFPANVTTLAAGTLFTGLVTGSEQLQIRCVELFAELVQYATFARQFASSLPVGALSALLTTKHRRRIFEILTFMAGDEQIRNTIVKLLPDAIQRLSNEDYRDYGHDLSEITAFSAAVIVPRYTADRIPWAIDNRVACLETISKLLSTLGGRNSAAHRSALDASIALVQHDEVRAATFFDEMASKVISLVAHEDLHIQQGALNAVTALAYSDPLRASISGETISRILSLLHSENPNAVICALHCCISLVHYADIRKSICSPEMVFKIVSLLDAAPTTDELPTTANIRRSALDAIRAFACYVDVPLSIYPGDTISQVISRLEDQDARTQQSAFDTIANLASYDHVRAYICAKQTISQVISKLHDASWQAQLWLSNSLVVLMQYDDLRASVAAGEGITEILSMLEDAEWHVRTKALIAVVSILPYDNVLGSVWAGKIIDSLIHLLEDENTHVCHYAFSAFVSLLHCDETRIIISRDEAIHKVVAALNHPERAVRRHALRAITSLGQYDDVCTLICVDETIAQILSMLENDTDIDDQASLDSDFIKEWSDDGCTCVLDATVSLLRSDNARVAMSDMVVSKILRMLRFESSQVREHALHAIAQLVQYDEYSTPQETQWTDYGIADIRTAICASPDLISILREVIFLCQDDEPDVRQSADIALMALGLYDETRAAIFSGDLFFNVASLMHAALFHRGQLHATIIRLLHVYDVSRYICEMIPSVVSRLEYDSSRTMPNVLAALIIVMEDNNARQSITPDVISQIGARLVDLTWGVDEHTLASTIILIQYAEFGSYFPFTQTTSKILPHLRHSNLKLHIIQQLLAYLAWDDVRNLPLRVEQTLSFVDGRQDHNYLTLIEGFVKRDVTIVGSALFRDVLPRIQQTNLDVRRSYTKLILMLPSSFGITSEAIDMLTTILNNSDVSILQCGLTIVIHFASNVHLRANILRANFFSTCPKLLRRPDTASMALQVILEFSKYEDIRGPLIQTPGVVHELLIMMKEGTSNIDRWHTGLSGLMALDLFSSHHGPRLRDPLIPPLTVGFPSPVDCAPPTSSSPSRSAVLLSPSADLLSLSDGEILVRILASASSSSTSILSDGGRQRRRRRSRSRSSESTLFFSSTSTSGNGSPLMRSPAPRSRSSSRSGSTSTSEYEFFDARSTP